MSLPAHAGPLPGTAGLGAGGVVYTAVRSVNTLGPGQPSPSRISFNHYVFALWPQMLSDGSLNISQVTLHVLILLRVDDVKKKSAVNT